MKKVLIAVVLSMFALPAFATAVIHTLSGSVTLSVNGSNIHDSVQINSLHNSLDNCNAAKTIVMNEPVLRATSDATGWFKHAAAEETGGVDIDIPFTRVGNIIKTVDLSCLPK